MDEAMLKEFLWGAKDDCAHIERLLLEIENGSQQGLTELYRAMHSLKGAAGLLSLPLLEKIAHDAEDFLQRHTADGAPAMEPKQHQYLIACHDAIVAIIQNLELHGKEGDIAEPSPDGPFTRTTTKPSGSQSHSRQTHGHQSPPQDSQSQPTSKAVLKGTQSTVAAPRATTSHTSTAKSQDPPAGTQVSSTSTNESTPDQTVRISIALLDRLMNQVGELVLARNQVLQGISRINDSALLASSRSLDQVTSEIQESIMQTRMQPISAVFNKFPRIVRDLSRQLGKKVDLTVTGKDTELDRTLLEAIRDPFTHLLRNALDHGIETPDQRQGNGKNATGRLDVRAFHEGGQVIVEIQDDGAGINVEAVKAKALAAGLIDERQAAQMSQQDACMLICNPGLSTAQKVTNVSGRGVGMDVVKANIERIGGQVDIQSTYGAGTIIRIRIPLTLAIIPALMVGVGGRMVGIPQVNLVELVGLDVELPNFGIDRMNGSEVYRLRDRLLPIVRLRELMGEGTQAKDTSHTAFLAVVAAGEQLFGIVVDDVFDTEEIVVKPLSAHLAMLEHFAGATIRGDGRVCMILDIGGLGRFVGLRDQHNDSLINDQSAFENEDEYIEVLLACSGPNDYYAVPVIAIERIEQIQQSTLQHTGDQIVIAARGDLLPAMIVGDRAGFYASIEDDSCFALVVEGGKAGLLVNGITEILQVPVQQLRRCDGLACAHTGDGMFNHADRLVVLLSVVKALRSGMPGLLNETQANPAPRLIAEATNHGPEGGSPSRSEIGREQPPTTQQTSSTGTAVSVRLSGSSPLRVLYAEDAQFFQRVVGEILKDQGYEVDVVSDGRQALNALESPSHPYSLLLTDLEMPEMDGWQLTREVRLRDSLQSLPVLVLTSVADEQLRNKAQELGARNCLSKLDRDELVASIADSLNHVEMQGG
jgi:two-component system chemotaxis sensor kinase CheA